MPLWHRLVIAGAVFVVAAAVAKLVDRRLSRKQLAPEAVTRYRVLRRSIMTGIVVVGLLSALLVIPQVRAVAGGILASSAVVGLVVGFASQRTLGNFVAGLLIAFTQPLRLGDRVAIENMEGIVEEIGLTYTFIRTDEGARLVIPNEKLASDTIRNSTIRSPEKLAEVAVQVPLSNDLAAVVAQLRDVVAGEDDADVFVRSLEGNATIVVRARAADANTAVRLEHELRLRVHERLREQGAFAA
jgi:small-conductance mechanosensitive channel